MRLPIAIAIASGLALCAAHAVSDGDTSGQAASPETLLWARLAATVEHEVAGFDGAIGVAIFDLAGGRRLERNADTVFPTASSIKIAVLAELYRQDSQAGNGRAGGARLGDLYTMDARDVVPSSEIFEGLTPGVTRLTNRDLATFMVVVSDNAAANVLIARLGIANVNATLDRLGLPHTRLRRKMMDLDAARSGRENTSTPHEMVELLAALWQGKVLPPGATQAYFNQLSLTKDSYLPRLLPGDVRVANKPGSLEGVRTDSGIVYAKSRPFALSVMTSYARDERGAEATISRLGLAAYETFDRLGRGTPHGRLLEPPPGSLNR
jgi:beta-lactamase class A